MHVKAKERLKLDNYENHEFDKLMSQICECSHLRGEHNWSESKFNQTCLDDKCDCKTFVRTNKQSVIDKYNERTAEQFAQDEAKKYRNQDLERLLELERYSSGEHDIDDLSSEEREEKKLLRGKIEDALDVVKKLEIEINRLKRLIFISETEKEYQDNLQNILKEKII